MDRIRADRHLLVAPGSRYAPELGNVSSADHWYSLVDPTVMDTLVAATAVDGVHVPPETAPQVTEPVVRGAVGGPLHACGVAHNLAHVGIALQCGRIGGRSGRRWPEDGGSHYRDKKGNYSADNLRLGDLRISAPVPTHLPTSSRRTIAIGMMRCRAMTTPTPVAPRWQGTADRQSVQPRSSQPRTQVVSPGLHG